MLNSIFQKRFGELKVQFEAMPLKRNDHMNFNYYSSGVWQQWATSTQNLIIAVFGENSPHYKNFLDAFKNCNGREHSVAALEGIFLSAKEDYEGNYVFNVDLRISGEIFGDFVAMAKHSLSEGHKDVAAVLACAALEDTLKRFAAINGLDVSDKSMQEVVSALKSKGLVSGAQKTLLDSMPKVRDFAMHANWEKLTAPDVSSVIGFVEQFLLSKFS